MHIDFEHHHHAVRRRHRGKRPAVKTFLLRDSSKKCKILHDFDSIYSCRKRQPFREFTHQASRRPRLVRSLPHPRLQPLSFWSRRTARSNAAALAVRVLARGLQPGRERVQPSYPCDACNYGFGSPSRYTLASKAAALDRTTPFPPDFTPCKAIPLYNPFTES